MKPTRAEVVHLTHHYNEESRAECDIVAKCSAFLVGQEYGLSQRERS